MRNNVLFVMKIIKFTENYVQRKPNIIDKSILLNVILVFINTQIVQFLFNLYDI